MPPKSRAKIKDQVEQEGRVLLAISSLRKKEITNIREAARLYDVPRTTLQRRLNGSTNRAEKQANGLKLTKEEEESLVQWILSMDQRGAAPQPSHIQDMANILSFSLDKEKKTSKTGHHANEPKSQQQRCDTLS